MKSIVVGIGLVVLSIAGSVQPAVAGDWRLGALGGLNSTKLSGDIPSKTSYTSHKGLILGAVIDRRLTEDAWLSFQPRYQQNGTKSEVAVEGSSDTTPGPEILLDYVSLPVLLRIYANNQKTYVVGGFNVGYLIRGDFIDVDGTITDYKDLFRSTELSMDFGFGVMLPYRGTLVNIELRYEQGLLNLASNNEDGEDSNLPTRLRQSGLEFLVGVQWSLGGE
jgi:hypothetical protein